MKKVLCFGLMLLCGVAYSQVKQELNYVKMGNYLAKDDCVKDTFKNAIEFIESPNTNLKKLDASSEIVKDLKTRDRIVFSETEEYIIYSYIDDKNNVFLLRTKSKNNDWTKLTIEDKGFKSIKTCFAYDGVYFK